MSNERKIHDLAPLNGLAKGASFAIDSFFSIIVGQLPTVRAPKSGIADDWRAVGKDIKEAMRKHVSA